MFFSLYFLHIINKIACITIFHSFKAIPKHTGSFLYVTFFEILFEQLSVSRHIVLKTIFVFFGFVIEALLAIAGHDHGNEHTESGETNSSAHDDHDH